MSFSSRLFHITSAAEIERARPAGQYRPSRFEHEGFIHCSYARQVEEVAGRIFRATPGLVLIEIDPARVPWRVVEENLEGGAERYPHIYGPLPLDAVIRVHDFPCGADGTFRLPATVAR